MAHIAAQWNPSRLLVVSLRDIPPSEPARGGEGVVTHRAGQLIRQPNPGAGFKTRRYAFSSGARPAWGGVAEAGRALAQARSRAWLGRGQCSCTMTPRMFLPSTRSW